MMVVIVCVLNWLFLSVGSNEIVLHALNFWFSSSQMVSFTLRQICRMEEKPRYPLDGSLCGLHLIKNSGERKVTSVGNLTPNIQPTDGKNTSCVGNSLS
jgi:hypothetical protein